MKRIIAVFAIAAVAASCNNANQKNAALVQQQNTIDSMKMEMAKKQVVDSMNEVNGLQYTVTAPPAEPVKTEVRYKTRTVKSAPETRTVYVNQQAPAASTQPVYQEAPPQQKKGWSAKAKGALIGAGVGAVTGAAVSKDNKGKAAAIGGVIGAGTGLGAGAIIDKKNGR